MDFDDYLCHEEYIQVMDLLRRLETFVDRWATLEEMGLQWIFQRGQYQIIDRKLWFLAKIKYGI